SDLRLSDHELDGVLAGGAAWTVGRGLGERADLESIEAGGALPDADPAQVSKRARQRGRDQLGTLGSGNHFCEVGYVAERYDDAAAAPGPRRDAAPVSTPCGSRAPAPRVCDNPRAVIPRAARRHSIELPDPQLCCAPLGSPEADAYWGAMNAAANF